MKQSTNESVKMKWSQFGLKTNRPNADCGRVQFRTVKFPFTSFLGFGKIQLDECIR